MVLLPALMIMIKIWFLILSVIAFVLYSCKSTVQLKYDTIYSFQDNYALVEKDGKFGFIDTTLREIIKPTLDGYIGYDLSPYFFNNWLYGTRNDSLIVYDTSGSILHYYKLDSELSPNILSDQSHVIDTLKVKTSDDNYLYFGSNNWGCLSPHGDTIVPFEYETIRKGLDNSIICSRGDRKNLETYIYDFKGDTIWRTYNIPVFPWKINDCYFFYNSGKDIQIKDVNFRTLDTIYFQGIIVSEEYVWLKSDTSWNRYDSNLEFKDGPYEEVILNKYWGAIWKDKKVALIDSKGEIISPFIYEGTFSNYISNSKFIVARNKDLLHILNSKGEIISSLKQKDSALK